MKFLVITKMRHPVSPDIAMGLFDDLITWSKKYVASKQLEQTWGFAGMYAGGGILQVNSLEELDSIMTEYPFGPFSDIEIYGLTDLVAAVERAKKATG